MSAVADRNMEQLEAVLRGLSKKSAEEQIFRGVSSGWYVPTTHTYPSSFAAIPCIGHCHLNIFWFSDEGIIFFTESIAQVNN